VFEPDVVLLLLFASIIPAKVGEHCKFRIDAIIEELRPVFSGDAEASGLDAAAVVRSLLFLRLF
jgi:hypothetical protein